MIVMKFGGTSVKDATAMRRVLGIVHAQHERTPLVVLSACGGFTDKLLTMARCAGTGDTQKMHEMYQIISTHHITLCNELLANETYRERALHRTNTLLEELRVFCEGIALLGECTPRSLDAIASFGERLSTSIFTIAAQEQGLDALFHDARTTMRTDSVYTNATVQFSQLQTLSRGQILPHMEQGGIVITQGFIGSTEQRITTTLGRGGSDLSAALYGAALLAEEIQIWTDVSGVLSADPRVIPNAKSLPEISYAEVRQLSYYGAKVLHPDTIKPAVDKNIPVKVLNTFEPANPGTTIVYATKPEEHGLRAVTLMQNCMMIRFDASPDESAAHILADVLEYCHVQKVEILASVGNESSCAIVIRSSDSTIIPNANAVRTAVALLCACGPNLLQHGTELFEFASALQESSPLSVLYGSSDVSIIALLSPDKAQAALQKVHEYIAV